MSTFNDTSIGENFQTYRAWLRGLAAEVTENVDYISDEILGIHSPVSQTPLIINMGSSAYNKNNAPYLTPTAKLDLYRQDLAFWDKFINFKFVLPEQDPSGCLSLSTLLLIQRFISDARGLLLSREDLPSLSCFIKLKASSNIEQGIKFDDASVGGSLAVRLKVPNFLGDNAYWIFEGRIPTTELDEVFAHFTSFDKYKISDPRLPVQRGEIVKKVDRCYDALFIEAIEAFKELIDDRIRL